MLKKMLSTPTLFAIGILLGLISGVFQTPLINAGASITAEIFINLLKLVSLPIIFLSIVSVASKMESPKEMRYLGKKVIKYTIFTTLIAASVALSIYLAINPAGELAAPVQANLPTDSQGYLHYLIAIIPSNMVQPFVDNHVIGVLFLAMLLSFSILSLPEEHRKTLAPFFNSLYAAVMKITSWIIALMPLAIWAFITLFVRDLYEGLDITTIASYLACILLANLFQACFVLPLFLKAKGISPIKLFREMLPALSVAFFSKSSSGALPMAVKCAESRAGISPKVAGVSLPLCTTINMNACAAFILITVLFVSMSHGITFSLPEMLVWILVATIAAVGNAGVPMGCYFIASAFLVSMNVPLNILGVILPFYGLIDMLESAINVWSDSCVTAVVDKELHETETITVTQTA